MEFVVILELIHALNFWPPASFGEIRRHHLRFHHSLFAARSVSLIIARPFAAILSLEVVKQQEGRRMKVGGIRRKDEERISKEEGRSMKEEGGMKKEECGKMKQAGGRRKKERSLALHSRIVRHRSSHRYLSQGI